MHKNLPLYIKNQILRYLTNNNFAAAKELYKKWLKERGQVIETADTAEELLIDCPQDL